MKVKVEHKTNGYEVTTRKILREIIRKKAGNKGLHSIWQNTYGTGSKGNNRKRKKSSLIRKIFKRLKGSAK